jgi:hypothetical protein
VPRFVAPLAVVLCLATASSVLAASTANVYDAWPPAECAQLGTSVQHALRRTTPVSATTVSLKQNPRNIATSCRVRVHGLTAVDYPSMSALFAPIDKLLVAQGFVQNLALDADGPTGLVRVYYGRPAQKIVEVDITQALTAGSCPGNQPIAACFEAVPKNHLAYDLRIDAAQR